LEAEGENEELRMKNEELRINSEEARRVQDGGLRRNDK